MEEIIKERRNFSDQKFQKLRDLLSDAPKICKGKACVYVTGSFGRREASRYSDIDLFIVSEIDKSHEPCLKRLDEIRVQADLIKASKSLKFPDFSGDGKWLQGHTKGRLIKATGGRSDDSENTFTARLLLLLESRPLIEKRIHSTIIDEVIARYWEEYPQYSSCFMPGFLANDILRFWRTLCLNYEAYLPQEGPDKRAKRRLDNYKLKHSRMLTCYSALIFLLHIFTQRKTVKPEDARMMVGLTPTQRMEYVAKNIKEPEIAAVIARTLDLYCRFLDVTNAPKPSLHERFSDDAEIEKLKKEQSSFGDLVFEALRRIGTQREDCDRFYRRLVV